MRHGKVRLLKRAYSTEESREHMRQFQADFDLLATFADEWASLHPGTWVGVYRGEVFGPVDTMEHLLETFEKRGIPKAHAVTHRFTAKDEVWILSAE